MGYLYLFFSLISGATKGFFGKKVSALVTGTRVLRPPVCSGWCWHLRPYCC